MSAFVVLLLAFADAPKVERQPLAAQAGRVAQALALAGAPLAAAEKAGILAAATNTDEARAVAAIQTILDKHVLFHVHVGKKTVKAERGAAPAELAEQGWRVFLVKVLNPEGISKRRLAALSPNALPLTKRSAGKPSPIVTSVGEVKNRFLDLTMLDAAPLAPTLSGLEVEYRLMAVYCRDAGRKEASFRFRVTGADGKSGAIQSEAQKVAIEAVPAVLVKLQVQDSDGATVRDGRPVMAAFIFRDEQGRVHPSPARRLAPDFNFHSQVYRADGETIALQPGKYRVSWTRGPEYLLLKRTITVPAGKTHSETFKLRRWVHLAKKGWWSGDHHIHAAGCAHYESPTEGVTPEDMMRHLEGEDLNVGCCLSWGPCWYHQKRYFNGGIHPLSTASHLLRYDVEVSGFPSSHCGHVCLLNLREQDYPGTKVLGDWPSWNLPIFKWAKNQGGVVGFAHSGWGLDVGATRELPNYIVPPMNGIGANEYLVDVALGQCDFLSTVDTPAIWELNIWYHTLNCGFRTRISGETDFPCIYGQRVGIGRSYVHLDGKLDFGKWAEGIKAGRCYVSDGKSHLIDFTANGLGVGLKGSELKLEKPGTVTLKATVAALLEPTPTAATEKLRKSAWNVKPYWDLERCRIGKTRMVTVEAVVNGKPVGSTEVEANGSEVPVSFKVKLDKSGWVALRILGSSHTNPVFVEIGGKPIRASRKSAEWCLKGVDKCWGQKKARIRAKDRKAAEKAYDEARGIYRRLIKESEVD